MALASMASIDLPIRRTAGMISALCLTLWLGACGTSAPTVASREPGSATTTPESAMPDQSALRDKIQAGLLQGLGEYRLSPGDTVDVLYVGTSRPSTQPFVIGVGDRLKVEFHFVDEPARQLLVRPDGYITLPIKGDVRAAGRTPSELAADIRALFTDIYKEPRVTVAVEQFTSRIEDLRTALASSDRGRSQKMVISPDGKVYLPFLPGVQVSGMTVDEMRVAVNQLYRRDIGNLEVSVLLDGVTGNRVMVFGEVQRPGVVQIAGNMTAIQALAGVGGVLPSGSLANVKVLDWSPADKAPRLRTLNLEDVFGRGQLGDDIVLTGITTIYVPPTAVTAAGRFIDQYLRQLFLFNGTAIGISYQK